MFNDSLTAVIQQKFTTVFWNY